jgi:hypothetical protein
VVINCFCKRELGDTKGAFAMNAENNGGTEATAVVFEISIKKEKRSVREKSHSHSAPFVRSYMSFIPDRRVTSRSLAFIHQSAHLPAQQIKNFKLELFPRNRQPKRSASSLDKTKYD